MLVIDGQPLVRDTAVLRKFISTRNTQRPEAPSGNTALVIGDPATRGFHELTGGTPGDDPVPLPGALQEARAVVEVLHRARFSVESAVSGRQRCRPVRPPWRGDSS